MGAPRIGLWLGYGTRVGGDGAKVERNPYRRDPLFYAVHCADGASVLMYHGDEVVDYDVEQNTNNFRHIFLITSKRSVAAILASDDEYLWIRNNIRSRTGILK